MAEGSGPTGPGVCNHCETHPSVPTTSNPLALFCQLPARVCLDPHHSLQHPLNLCTPTSQTYPSCTTTLTPYMLCSTPSPPTQVHTIRSPPRAPQITQHTTYAHLTLHPTPPPAPIPTLSLTPSPGTHLDPTDADPCTPSALCSPFWAVPPSPSLPALTPRSRLQQSPGHEDEVQVVLGVAQCQHGHAPSTQVQGVQRGEDGTERLCAGTGA